MNPSHTDSQSSIWGQMLSCPHTHTVRRLVPRALGALHKRYMWFVGARASGFSLVWALLDTSLLSGNKQ